MAISDLCNQILDASAKLKQIRKDLSLLMFAYVKVTDNGDDGKAMTVADIVLLMSSVERKLIHLATLFHCFGEEPK